MEASANEQPDMTFGSVNEWKSNADHCSCVGLEFLNV